MGRFGDYGLADVDYVVQRVFQRPKHRTYSPHTFYHCIPFSIGARIAQEHFDQQSNRENQSPSNRIEVGKKWQIARL
jgi:ornithine carbamoyltransferase